MNHSTKTKQADRKFLIYLFVLVVFGLVALTSASGPSGYEKFGDSYFYVKRQILFGLLPGLVGFLVLARIPYHIWQKFSLWVYGITLVLLILVFVPGMGIVINGSHSWLALGNFTFQSSELAKLAVIIMAAHLLSDPKRDLTDWKNGLLPILAILAPALILVLLQPDIGTLSILVVIIFMMLYLAKIPKSFLAVLGALAAIAFVGLMLLAPYRVQRLTTFLHPELDPKGVGYHINQAFLAVGSGGVWGLGLGHSRQKFQYLPEVDADSIFAVIAEETGFIFSVCLVVLILLFSWRGLSIASAAPDLFGKLLSGGIMVWFFWQSFLNIGAMVGAVPLTGVPLPFISHGGSALAIALASMGMVASVSRNNY